MNLKNLLLPQRATKDIWTWSDFYWLPVQTRYVPQIATVLNRIINRFVQSVSDRCIHSDIQSPQYSYDSLKDGLMVDEQIQLLVLLCDIRLGAGTCKTPRPHRERHRHVLSTEGRRVRYVRSRGHCRRVECFSSKPNRCVGSVSVDNTTRRICPMRAF